MLVDTAAAVAAVGRQANLNLNFMSLLVIVSRAGNHECGVPCSVYHCRQSRDRCRHLPGGARWETQPTSETRVSLSEIQLSRRLKIAPIPNCAAYSDGSDGCLVSFLKASFNNRQDHQQSETKAPPPHATAHTHLQPNHVSLSASVLPQLHNPVFAAGGDHGAVRAPVHRVHLVRVPRQVQLQLLAAHVPHLQSTRCDLDGDVVSPCL